MAELLDRVDSRELSEWIEFYRLEPFGQDWLQTAQLSSLLVNTNPWRGSNAKTWGPADFMPAGYRCPKRRSSRRARNRRMRDQLRAWAMACGQVK